MAVLVARQARHNPPIRPFRLAHDLPALADLLESSFGEDLRRTNSQIVVEMRDMASWGLSLHLLAILGSPYQGLVWEEDGHILGNITMVRERKGIWSLSNIAVSPEARGRGIASALLDSAIASLRDSGAQYLTLQVRPENQIAVGMYQRRGFVACDRTEELIVYADRWPVSIGEPSNGALIRRPLREDVPGIMALINESTSELVRQLEDTGGEQWQRGTLRAAARSLAASLKGKQRLELVALSDGLALGVAWATVRLFGLAHDIGLLVSAGDHGHVAQPLLDRLLLELAPLPRRDLHATISTLQPEALEALHRVGFETVRVLDRMVLTLG